MPRTTTTAPTTPPHACRRGWLGLDAQGHPRPCLICRPHLAPTGTALALAAVDGEPVTRKDRDGSETLAEPIHYCRGGWVGTDLEGRPMPCYVCKPHLRPDRRRPVEAVDDWDPIR